MNAAKFKQTLPLVLLLVALVSLLAYVLYNSLEYYEEEIDLGWSVKARLNPYLAAEQFLRNMDADVESSYQLEVIGDLSEDAILFISDANAVLNERHAERLREWMARGGHVIIAAQMQAEGQRDVFLDYFGVEKYSDEEDFDLFDFDGEDEEESEEDKRSLGDRFLEDAEKAKAEQEKERELERLKEEGKVQSLADELVTREERIDPSRIMNLTFGEDDYRYRVLLSREEYLSHPAFYDDEHLGPAPFYWQGVEAGVGFMQFEVEEGLLTVLSDQSIWTSEKIALFDHALLLQILTENASEVVFLYGADVPSLYELIWQHFFEVTFCLLLILVTWLYYRSRRFGPVLDTSYLGRRSFREHLSAVGEFFWRYKQREALLNSARVAVWSEMSKKHFATRNDSEAEKLNSLAELTGETPERVRVLMVGEVPADEFMFFQRVKSLQKLRKQL